LIPWVYFSCSGLGFWAGLGFDFGGALLCGGVTVRISVFLGGPPVLGWYWVLVFGRPPIDVGGLLPPPFAGAPALAGRLKFPVAPALPPLGLPKALGADGAGCVSTASGLAAASIAGCPLLNLA
jgi:hypothetical protein